MKWTNLLIPIVLILLSGLAYAQEEYVNGWQVPIGIIGSDYYSPKVACDSNHDNCIMLTYDNIAVGRGVSAYVSGDSFKTISKSFVLAYIDYTAESNLLSYGTNYSLPYDVYYDSTQNIFYLTNYRTSYKYDLNTLTTLCSVNTDTIFLGYDSSGNILGLQFPYGAGTIYLRAFDPDNCSVIHDYGSIGSTTAYCTSAPCTQHYIEARGFVTEKAGTVRYKLFVRTRTNLAGWVSTLTFTSLGSFPTTDYQGIHYYDGYNMIVYRHNDSANITNGIYLTTTSDLTTYSSLSLYYPFNASANETIPMTDAYFSGNKKTWVFERRGTNEGIYAYEKQYRTFNLFIYKYNQTSETYDPEQVSVTLQCGNETSSGYGSFVSLYTSCTSGINITLQSLNVVPSYYKIENLSSLCLTTYIYVTYLSDSDVQFTVIDGLTSNPISNAQVYLDSDSCSTSSLGRCIITTNPIQNPYLSLNQTGTCSYSVTTKGSPKEFLLKIEKSGYVNLTETGLTLVKFDALGNPIYTTKINRKLEPLATRVKIHLKTLDDVEIFPKNAILYLNGSDNITWFRKGVFYNISLTKKVNEFPAYLFFDDNRTSFTLTMNLSYAGKLYNDTMTVYKDVLTEHDFILPFTSSEIPCVDMSDCESSFCAFNNYYKLTSCDGICRYTVEECPIYCDDEKGCYDVSTGYECVKDRDCNSTCIDPYTMLVGLCGSDGYCIGKIRECETYCNETEGFCEELRNCEYGTSMLFKLGEWEFTYTCDKENAGQKVCIVGTGHGIQVASLPDVIIPKEWGYSYNQTTGLYEFYDIALYCDKNCTIHYEICPSGCSEGECLAKKWGFEDWIYAVTPYWLLWVWNPTILWTFFSIAVGIGSVYYLGRGLSINEMPWQLGIAVMFMFFVVGLITGFVEPIIGLMILIGLGILLAREITKHG